MFDAFSDRARRIVFLSRKMAGRRGAAAIEVEDLIAAAVAEDQGDFLKVFSENAAAGAYVPVLPQHHPFLVAETAADVRRRLEPLLPAAKALPDSVDMPLSDELQEVLAVAIKLGEELGKGSSASTHIRVGHVQPLHLMAAALAKETSATAQVLKQAGISKEAVIAAIESGEYS